ncbi:nuclear transport factor 2 family protein [Rhodophyticola sp.]|uniref:nuclear transport factor 2 family protein n=1 Tax=Rhodophyticola sp. TaxID=2680032 RepID=UPI003D2A8D3F
MDGTARVCGVDPKSIRTSSDVLLSRCRHRYRPCLYGRLEFRRSRRGGIVYAEDGEIILNRGEPWTGRARVAQMAAGFYADVPDLALPCHVVRPAGDHVIFVWSLTGHDAGTGNPLKISGWEEWDLDEDGKVIASKGWFDAEDYARQASGD